MQQLRELDLGEAQIETAETRRELTFHTHRETEARNGRCQYLTRLTDQQASAVKALRELIAKMGKYTGTDMANRAIICTPGAGDYGHITSWVITVEGSPPRGTIFISVLDDVLSVIHSIFFVDAGKSRRLGDKQRIVVNRFLDMILGGRSYRLIEGVTPVIVAEHIG
jgi:hypothetical protein